jgi:hypothetical protein
MPWLSRWLGSPWPVDGLRLTNEERDLSTKWLAELNRMERYKDKDPHWVEGMPRPLIATKYVVRDRKGKVLSYGKFVEKKEKKVV